MIGTFTDFADQSILLPIEIVVFLSLSLSGRKRDAAAWGLAMLSGCVAIVCLKLWFERCGIPHHHRFLYSPSGHSMGGTMVYGGLLALFCRRTALFLAGTVALAVAFSASRVLLGAHTMPEVITGATVGFCVACALRFALGPRQTIGLRTHTTLITLALVCAIGFGLHGYRLGCEVWIQEAARRMLGSVLCH
ncbi:phosphatase PAP2 family protein [Acetobacter oeni]|uniref:Phosphatidic acid phosphatase type 2/haloperoxidase domain-containing protein n=1 Tax=Acetobacter oeni TaxID=304077 RepID=A0A511XHJ2_9PROT|nr:phosphatase PAP2 family protein [Acetobacter oeni]MBB3881260.1 membrane-associated phospholipid phosphatase [Acetobacter oeni]NHO18135.1 phosphatase PAP2 family protein [Acetobacter oeni]GBR08179.1 hypothetical protein AA21952_2539 [Acetobacter oeni LMG 21952]GEN62415.1 hypothetical protein AOE01nite_06390 [Acetobacter oeni]